MILKENQEIVIDIQYLPNWQFFAVWLQSEQLILDVFEHFEKQTYRNRTRVMTANGVFDLVVPVLHQSSKQALKEVKIDNAQKWMNVHWRTIFSAYGKAPFFEYYADDFAQIYAKKYAFLLDLNLDLLTICRKFLKIAQTWVFSEKYIESIDNQGFIDLRSIIHPKKKYPNLAIADIRPYPQVFGKGFDGNVSIIDLLFCEGPQAIQFLREVFQAKPQHNSSIKV
jgi:hypothetical protein